VDPSHIGRAGDIRHGPVKLRLNYTDGNYGGYRQQ